MCVKDAACTHTCLQENTGMGMGHPRARKRSPGHNADEQAFSTRQATLPTAGSCMEGSGWPRIPPQPPGVHPCPAKRGNGRGSGKAEAAKPSPGTSGSHLCWAVAHPPTLSLGSEGPGQSSAWSTQCSPAFCGDFLSPLLI